MGISKTLADRSESVEGVDIVSERGVVTRVGRRYRIEDLVADLSHDALRDAFDWGPDRGREMGGDLG